MKTEKGMAYLHCANTQVTTNKHIGAFCFDGDSEGNNPTLWQKAGYGKETGKLAEVTFKCSFTEAPGSPKI